LKGLFDIRQTMFMYGAYWLNYCLWKKSWTHAWSSICEH